MTDIVAQSRASVETAQIAETDKKADELIVYLMATFRTNLTSPIQAMRNAAETLYLKTKPYVGCQTLPQGQQIQKMRGLLSDLSTADMSAHITTLGLTAVVEELNTITSQYSASSSNVPLHNLPISWMPEKPSVWNLMSNTMTL